MSIYGIYELALTDLNFDAVGAEEIFLTSIFHPVTEFQGSVCTRDGLSVHFHWRRLGCWQDKRRWEEWFHLLPQVEDFQLWRGVSSSQGSTQRRFTVQLNTKVKLLWGFTTLHCNPMPFTYLLLSNPDLQIQPVLDKLSIRTCRTQVFPWVFVT